MKNMFIKICALISYLAMVVVNFLANSLPINNRSTGEISDLYSNLFAPSGFTFSIWGLIYILLAGYLLYQFLTFLKKRDESKEILLKRVNLFFIASSIANILWIFSWHYDLIGLSVVIMILLLIFLIKISNILSIEKLKSLDRYFVVIAFNIYFAWITIATIANITVFLKSIGWSGFGINDFMWTSIILLLGVLIGMLRMLKDEEISYGLVLIWAYFGILVKHISQSGFNMQYPIVITILIVSLILYIGSIVFIMYRKYFDRKHVKRKNFKKKIV